MAIHYRCRHCGVELGTIESLSIETNRLGFHKLTDDERLDMIFYSPSGDIQIKVICEDCQELLQRNPDYYQYDFLIH
ncbi:anti-sigma-F factor Fin family protein [Cytobacillus sp. Hz8]|uniref:anti-sigma-F factor Fin family protein n=1 Tax=Cytobacillus sp. Hz8 TaxID=3347168 RepID=UPI0035E2D304